MEQPITNEEINNIETMPLCQKCLEKVATKICPDCGCPLCWECIDKHACLNDEQSDFKFRSNKRPRTIN
jgi:hypothetical protein